MKIKKSVLSLLQNNSIMKNTCQFSIHKRFLKGVCLSAMVTILMATAYGQSSLKPIVKEKRGLPLSKHVTYHVSTEKGSDNNDGTSRLFPFKTIQKAADLAIPGDTVLVYAGVYRERVKPLRGGTSESNRITYMAKAGDHVIITGLDTWKPTWSKEDDLYVATPAKSMFTDSNYVDGGNPYKIGYWVTDSISLGQVVVDDIEYSEQKSKAAANVVNFSWWADQKTGTIYIHFDGSPINKKVEITTRRGVFRPYLKGLGYITVEGFDLAYCGNNGATPGVGNQLHPLYQSGLIGTRQGHHWKIINNKIRKAKGLGLSFSLGVDLDDKDWWDPHGILHGNKQIEVDYPKLSEGDNETVAGNSQMKSMPYKEVGFNIIAGNDFEDCGMNAIAGIGGVGNTIYGNRFSNCAYLISGESVEDAAIKMHMQYGTLIERNLFENFHGDHRGVWMDNNNPATRIRRNVFLNHPGGTPTIFLEITSSLDQYLSVVDNNLFLNCKHGVVSAAADGVAFYNNLFYKCGDGFSMGSNRDQNGSDYGNMRIHSWNNLFIDQERAFGFAYNQAVNFHTSDYNLMYRPKEAAFCKYLLSDGGTGKGPGGRPNTVEYKQADITVAKSGGNYWKEKVNWGANNGPNGCEADLGYWRGTMGATIDRHSEERPSIIASSNTDRTITLNLGSQPKITGAPKKIGAEIDFFGHPISASPEAGPFQDLGATAKTYTFWNDQKMPELPKLPAAPSDVVVTIKSDSSMQVTWRNQAPDASFMYIERRVNGGDWKFWGYITTTQESMLDYNLPTKTNQYEYRIAARNAAGLSSFAYAEVKRYKPNPSSAAKAANNYKDIFILKETSEDIDVKFFSLTLGNWWGENNPGLISQPNGYHCWGATNPTQKLVDAYKMSDGTQFDWLNPVQAADPYSNRDPRFYASILYDGAPWRQRPPDVAVIDPFNKIQTSATEVWNATKNKIDTIQGVDTRKSPIESWNGTWTNYYMNKFMDPAFDAQYFRQDAPWRFIRYTEILLDYAECCLTLGQETEAKTYINMIRHRAFMPDVPPSETGAALLATYRNERFVELSFENTRFFDIRRWMIGPSAYVNAQGIDILHKLNPDHITTTPSYKVVTIQQRAWNNKYYLLPIGLSEINKNDKLIQNPLY